MNWIASRSPHSTRSKGFALVITLFAVILIATLSFTLVSVVTMNGRGASLEASTSSAYYLAQSGLAYAEQELAAKSTWPG
ncbi:MAG: PilX N-terminal domain-containing pilus assembly protein, partial [Candidatus Xenobia bacterium]